MKRLPVLFLVAVAAGCAHLPGQRPTEVPVRADLWREAHMALYLEDFARADTLFRRLAEQHAETDEGREAVFYLGTLQLDPRNRDWSSERAEASLRRYLDQDTIGTLIHRRPEAIALLELAKQLNLPPDERMAALVPESPPIDGDELTRRIVRADQQREMATEIDRLRRQVAERDEQIRRQREELERIRRTLAPRTP